MLTHMHDSIRIAFNVSLLLKITYRTASWWFIQKRISTSLPT